MIIPGVARKPEQLRKSQHGRGRRDGSVAKVGRWPADWSGKSPRELSRRRPGPKGLNKHRDLKSGNTEARCGGHSDWGTVAWTRILAKRFYDPRKRFAVTLFLVTPR